MILYIKIYRLCSVFRSSHDYGILFERFLIYDSNQDKAEKEIL